MKQTFQQEFQESVSVERSVGNLFEEFLESKGQPLESFGKHAENVLVSLDGEVLRAESGFPAKVAEILKMVVKPSQEVKFLPLVASG